MTAVVESGKAGEGHLLGALDPESAARRAASGTEGSTPTPSRALAQNGCLRWNAKTFTPADKRASLETEAYFPRGLSGKSSELRFRAHTLPLGQCGKRLAVAADECGVEAACPDQQFDQPRIGFRCRKWVVPAINILIARPERRNRTDMAKI